MLLCRLLLLSAGALSPAFNKDVTAYTVNLPTGSTALTITATANHAKATVAGAGAQSFTNTGKTASIVVTAEDGTTKTYTVTITVGVGVDEFAKAGIKMYPNPAKNYLNVTGLKDNAVVKVINAAGQQVSVQNATTNAMRINVQSLSKGMYMLRVETDGKVLSSRFVKE
jgi:hypothetical protein